MGAAAIVLPSYWLAGPGAIQAELHAADRAPDLYQPWQLLPQLLPAVRHHQWLNGATLAATVVLAAILLWRLAAGPPGLPAVRPALALTFAWLIWSPQQRPWFDTMIFPLLALMPASRLDWIALLRAAAGAVAELPGVAYYSTLRPYWLDLAASDVAHQVAPAALVGAALALVWLCLRGRLSPWSPGTGGRQVPAALARPG
jgi:hypothetical protein